MKEKFSGIKSFFVKYERHISIGAFLAGFIIDNLTLTRIDLLFDNLVLFSYLITAAAAVVFLSAYERGALSGRLFSYVRTIAPIVMQYAFGGLFSGFFIFYSRSASISDSWPFLLLLAFLLFGNEFFRARYARKIFRISIFYFTLFSFLIFYVPIVIGSMGARVFLLSGFISIIIIAFFIKILARISTEQISGIRNTLIASIAGIFIAINIMYFANIVPPIPLSLKDAGVYHFVARENGNYKVLDEERIWREHLPFIARKIHIRRGEPVYFYSAVFAPAKITTPIFHEWQYFDEAQEKWITANRIGFQISGGRDGGYRGYTIKQSIFPGRWRVNVATGRGQALGRVYFIVEEVKAELKLKQKII